MRRFLVLAALVLAPAALADGGGGPGVVEGGAGVLSANGAVRYVTLPGIRDTVVEAVNARTGVVIRSAGVAGNWGIPAVAYDGSSGGLSRNNRTLVLASSNQVLPLRTTTSFQIVDPKVLGSQLISLRGDFAYDALSPNGRMLYLIQHVSLTNVNKYVVRAYDLDAEQLLPRRIADRTQRGWVMQGIPVARTTSPNGRFVYTLYENPGGYPFVHALDTARAVAHCYGVPLDQRNLVGAKLTLQSGRLAIAPQGTPTYDLNLR